ncbi:hypothetical protein ACEN2J_16565 [Pseudorhodobacter sp. W20_MBD10_FR17]|uniref:hypothetical protein n=1 Tax=Pseudorhodobacter sp. W20_MBD10_FR17 TaxID=3240266 RepID=UPI003F965D1F
MTIFADNTLPPVSKAPAEVQMAFEGLLGRLKTLCAAEQDIVDLAHGDPAFDAWFRDAETARTVVLAAAAAVMLAAPRSSLDQRFRKACFALEILLVTSDPDQFAKATSFLRRNAERYCEPVEGAVQAALLFRRFYRAFDVLMALPDYAPEALSCDMTMAVAA